MSVVIRGAALIGIRMLVGMTLADNLPMLFLTSKFGFRRFRRDGDANVIHLELRFNEVLATR